MEVTAGWSQVHLGWPVAGHLGYPVAGHRFISGSVSPGGPAPVRAVGVDPGSSEQKEQLFLTVQKNIRTVLFLSDSIDIYSFFLKPLLIMINASLFTYTYIYHCNNE